MRPSGSVVQVKLSGGSVTLPDFVGLSRRDALFQIQQLQLTLTEVREIPVDDASQFERVAAQYFEDNEGNSFSPGDQVMQKTQVTLAVYVSSQAPTPQPSQESAEGEPTP